ncbi:Ankyrin-1 [Fasciolopsis buskii]|uniref:Ankyrin-1 n=1 Tax=Fasciolopsis buskii TaxID=27845 RepID=A0A8E0RQF0_9TREM|nr:Ankyrin-1 [Fasciolopsis buski]
MRIKNPEDEYDFTELIVKGDMEIIARRLTKFPDICHWQNDAGDFVAHVACQHARSDVVMLLGRLDYNFDDEYNSSGFLPIHTACLYRNIDCVLALKICGADLNAVTESDHWTPLHIACRIAYLPLIHVLLRLGVKTNAREALGKTPHDVASSHGLEKVLLLMDTHKNSPQNSCTCIQFLPAREQK